MKKRHQLLMIAMLSSGGIFAQKSLEVKKDTVILSDVEVVVKNSSKDLQGFLFNSNYGTTSFRKIGKAMQFSVGVSNFPGSGDSVYINSDFKNKNIKVWRSGKLQNGAEVKIDPAAGKIIFTPVLIANEKIYIEVFNSDDFSI